jgi:RNA polymerase sigma-70 factor (ECF subfamily)
MTWLTETQGVRGTVPMAESQITTEVIARAQRGDASATSLIYQTYVTIIYRYVAYRVGSDEDAEDITAEVFVRMVESLSSYTDTGAPFEAWLYRIAAARVADFYRKRKRRTHVELTDNLVSDDTEPEERLLEHQEAIQLREAVRHLGEEEQTILLMRFVERKSHYEVAELLDKSVSAVKSAQHRALVKLAGLLGSDEKARHYLRGQND